MDSLGRSLFGGFSSFACLHSAAFAWVSGSRHRHNRSPSPPLLRILGFQ